MKKLLVIILMLGSVSAFGQFTFGIKGGVNFNDMAVKNIPDGMLDPYVSNIGFHIGLYGMLPLAEKIFFTPEVQFSHRGATYDGDDTRENVNYIEVPLLLSYAPVKKLKLDIGPNVGFKVSASCNCDDYARVDAGVTGGLRFSLSEEVSVIARYYMGLTSMRSIYFTGPADEPLGESKQYNRNGQLGLSFKIK